MLKAKQKEIMEQVGQLELEARENQMSLVAFQNDFDESMTDLQVNIQQFSHLFNICLDQLQYGYLINLKSPPKEIEALCYAVVQMFNDEMIDMSWREVRTLMAADGKQFQSN